MSHICICCLRLRVCHCVSWGGRKRHFNTLGTSERVEAGLCIGQHTCVWACVRVCVCKCDRHVVNLLVCLWALQSSMKLKCFSYWPYQPCCVKLDLIFTLCNSWPLYHHLSFNLSQIKKIMFNLCLHIWACSVVSLMCFPFKERAYLYTHAISHLTAFTESKLLLYSYLPGCDYTYSSRI